MSSRHWLESLYETFAMRDLVGYVAPGGVLITGFLCELGKTQFLRDVVFHPWALAVLATASYLVATGLRLLGTIVPILLFHRDSALWGVVSISDVSNEPPKSPCRLHRFLREIRSQLQRLAPYLWKADETWLRSVYSQYTEDDRRSLDRREDVFTHLTGLSSMAFLLLAFAVIFVSQNGLSKTLNLSECQVVAALFVASVVFLLGHYRHAHQQKLLKPKEK